MAQCFIKHGDNYRHIEIQNEWMIGESRQFCLSTWAIRYGHSNKIDKVTRMWT